jgi:MFS transporter, DHA2 family, multidrug resistance protein
LTLETNFGWIVWLRVFQMAGVAFLFVPIQTMCYVGIPPEKNNNVSGMTNLARNMGGSLGISAVEMLLARRSQFHQQILTAHTSRFDPTFQSRVSAMTKSLIASGYDAVQAGQMAYARIYGMVQAQASMLSYLDAIWIFAVACLLVVPLPFLMHRAKRGSAPAPMH